MRKVLYILGQLSDDDVEWLIAHGRRERLAEGAALVVEGKPLDAVYIVLEGQLLVSTTGASLGAMRVQLPEKELARLGAGEIVGEMSFVDARPPSASVRALRDSAVLAVSRSRLEAKLEQDVGFAARFYRAVAIFLSDRLRSTVGRLGYGRGMELDEDVPDQDELDLNVLDNVHLAGARFHRILERLSG